MLLKNVPKMDGTGCAYCMPCPFGVDIPKNFRIWNDLSMYGNKEKAKQAFFQELDVSARYECKNVANVKLSVLSPLLFAKI